MTLSVELTPEEQVYLLAQAAARGVPLDTVIHNVLRQAVGFDSRNSGTQNDPVLPAWKGTVTAPLSREDIYGDAQ